MGLMVIFGAGASYDSAPRHPIGDRLPDRHRLADDLFKDRDEFLPALEAFEELHELIPRLLPKTGRSIEQVLQEIKNEARDDPKRAQELAAVRYYLRQVFSTITPNWWSRIRGITNYQALLGQIRHYKKSAEPVCLVTFNYDTLLELALAKHCKMSFDVVDNYVSGKEYQLFKLHGSHNWGRFLTAAPHGIRTDFHDPWGQPHEMIQHAATLSISNTFAVVTDTIAARFSGAPLFPAIAIPVTAKSQDSFECPAAHITQLTELIPGVNKILTVGWRGREEHFMSLFRGLVNNPKSPLTIVAIGATTKDADETFEEFRTLAMPIADYKAFGGFTETVSDNLLTRFLAL